VVYVSTVPASAAWVGAEADLGQEIAEELGRQVSRLVKHAKWPVIVVP
jgi:hypothetical protein